MSLKSTDMQHLIPKTAEISKLQHIQDRRSQVEQQQAGDRFLEHVAQQARHVPTAASAKDARIEREREDRRQRRGRERRAEEPEDEAQARDPSKGSTVDVRI